MIRKELVELVEKQEPGIQVKESSVCKGVGSIVFLGQNWTAFMRPELEEIKVKKGYIIKMY